MQENVNGWSVNERASGQTVEMRTSKHEVIQRYVRVMECWCACLCVESPPPRNAPMYLCFIISMFEKTTNEKRWCCSRFSMKNRSAKKNKQTRVFQVNERKRASLAPAMWMCECLCICGYIYVAHREVESELVGKWWAGERMSENR